MIEPSIAGCGNRRNKPWRTGSIVPVKWKKTRPIKSLNASLLFAAGVALAGCGNDRYAASSMRVCDESETRFKPVLSAGDQRQIRDAFDELAVDHQPVNRPQAAASVRWSDVAIAAVYACEEAEMAIVSQSKSDETYEFTLKTAEDYPGVLRVLRVDGPAVYEADARIGLFGDHCKRAEQLVNEFDKQMRAFGRKRKLGE